MYCDLLRTHLQGGMDNSDFRSAENECSRVKSCSTSNFVQVVKIVNLLMFHSAFSTMNPTRRFVDKNVRIWEEIRGHIPLPIFLSHRLLKPSSALTPKEKQEGDGRSCLMLHSIANGS